MSTTTAVRPAAKAPARRHLRAVPERRPAPRCPGCRSELDEWAIELARMERTVLECGRCGVVLT